MDIVGEVAVTMPSGVVHTWENTMWSVSSDDTLIIYGLKENEYSTSPKSYKVAQFARGAWSLVEAMIPSES